jgi:hypothetical protein
VNIAAALDTAKAAGPSAGHCAFTLPTVGVFALIATSGTPSGAGPIVPGAVVTTVLSLGRTQQQWDAAPLRTYDNALQVATDREAYNPSTASVIRLSFYNPLPHARVAVVLGSPASASAPALATPVVAMYPVPSTPGDVTLEVPLNTAACRANCEASVLVSSSASVALPIPVPVSALLEPTAGRLLVRSVPVTILSAWEEPLGTPPDALVGVSVPTAVAEPGATVPITVRVTDASGAGALAGQEVTVVVVDKAMLDLKPVPLPNLKKLFTPASPGTQCLVRPIDADIPSRMTCRRNRLL